MTVKSGTSQACAACKYQRRRCTPNCPLAPYFPADKPTMFQNAHRLYGVSNILKILRQLSDDQKDEAMKSIIFESEMREKIPVYGCCGVIWSLSAQMRQCQEELGYVNYLLANFREKAQCHIQFSSSSHYSQSSEFQSNVFPICYNNLGLSQYGDEMSLVQKQMLLTEKNIEYVESSGDTVNPSWIQRNRFDDVGFELQPHCDRHGVPIQQEIEVLPDYDDMPFDTVVDDRQSYIESKETCDSSAESSSKHSMQLTDGFCFSSITTVS